MNMSKRIGLATLTLMLSGLIGGCGLNTLTELKWDTEWVLPLASSESGLDDLIQDSTLSTNSDGLFALVFRDTLASIKLADLVSFPGFDLGFTVRLDSISLDPDTITEQITLEEVADQLIADGNIIGQLIKNSDSSTLFLVPAVPNLTSGEIPIDASGFFEFAKLDSGYLDLSINNNWPLTLENVVLEIRNATLPGPPLVRDTFPIIPAGTSRMASYDLAGAEIESQLIGELVNLDIKDSTNVYIEIARSIEVVLVARDLQAQEANAIFPAQTIFEQSDSRFYTFGEGNSAVRITDLEIKSGQITANSITTIEDSLSTLYRIDNATNDAGEQPEVSLKILPAPSGGVRNQTSVQSLEGFYIDMSNGGTSWSQLQDYFRADLLFSGKLVNIDQEDSLRVQFAVDDLVPVYAAGYFGSDNYQFEGDVSVKWRDGLNLGRIRFADPKATLIFANGLGIDGNMEILDLTATNTRTNESARLTTGALLAGPISLERPQLPDTFGIAQTRLEFKKDESNIVEVLEKEVDELHYDIRLTTNPDQNPFNFDDFATDQSEITAIVDLEIPLDGVVETLILEDTVELSPGSAEDIPAESGTIRLVLDNDYPLVGVASAEIEGANGEVIFVLADDFRIEGAIPGPEGRTTKPARSVLELSITKTQLEAILETGARVVYRYQLDTRPANRDVKFYSDYKVSTKITVQFPFQING